MNSRLKGSHFQKTFAAPYVGLGVFDFAHPGGVWSATYPWSADEAIWPIRLRLFEAQIFQSTGAFKVGAVIGLLAYVDTNRCVYIGGGVQSGICQPGFIGDLPLDHGFGLYVETKAIETGDYLYINYLYEMRKE